MKIFLILIDLIDFLKFDVKNTKLNTSRNIIAAIFCFISLTEVHAKEVILADDDVDNYIKSSSPQKQQEIIQKCASKKKTTHLVSGEQDFVYSEDCVRKLMTADKGQTPIKDRSLKFPPSGESISISGIRRDDCPSGYYSVHTKEFNDINEEIGDKPTISIYDATQQATIYYFCRKDGTVTQSNASELAPKGCTALGSRPDEAQLKNLEKEGKSAVLSGGHWYECPKPANSAPSGKCEADFQAAKNDCLSSSFAASDACNEENKELQSAFDAIKTVGLGASASIDLACSKLGDISKLANGALTGFQGSCALAQNNCQSSCEKARSFLDSTECITPEVRASLHAQFSSDIDDKLSVCRGYKQKINEAAQHLSATALQQISSKNCKTDVSQGNQIVATDVCKTNPNDPVCSDQQKCSNPGFAAQNPICACLTNPTSPQCIQASSFGSGSQLSGGSSGSTIPGVRIPSGKGSGAPVINPSANASPNGFGGISATGAGSERNAEGANIGGRQGDASQAGKTASGPGGNSANPNANAANGANRRDPSNDPTKVNSGFYGGAPGALGGAGAGGTSYYGKTNYPVAYNGAAGLSSPYQRQDLAKFDPRKYIVGQNGLGGFINTYNDDIFKIVQRRYVDKTPTLLAP